MGKHDCAGYHSGEATLILKFLLLSLFLVACSGRLLAQDVQTPSVLVETIQLSSKPVGNTVIAYGQVEPDPDAIRVISLPRAGLITQIFVRVGEQVAAGDPLLVMDTTPDTRLQYVQATAAQIYAEGQLARMRELLSERLATRDQVASAERALQDAESQVAALRDIGADQSQQTIRSNVNGIVLSMAVTTGDRIAADSAAITLAQSSGLIMRFGLEPEDARRLQAGHAIKLESVFQNSISFES